MLKINRKNKILQMLRQSDVLTYQELAEALNVSTMTVRRDVAELSKENAIIKEHGGVRRVTFKVKTTDEKRLLFPEEKDYIAQLAADLIAPKSVIYLGAGTTILGQGIGLIIMIRNKGIGRGIWSVVMDDHTMVGINFKSLCVC